ncbi:MAG: hypothetical protein FWH47_00950 [Methanomassiliicoccaceae archaeon]|nr:hypothetical protein [Methanomassiliicoccaceae archaeon]
MSIENATIRERALLHLNRFPGMTPSELFNVPFDLTQDGIATVLGISRAHASLELKKLKEVGKLDDWQAHIKGSGTKRRVYYLLPDGIAEAEQLRKRFEGAGIAVDALLDMKRCEPEVMWDSLSAKDKATFGAACVFRVKIDRRTLPETSTGVIPADFYGMTCISDAVRERYLSLATPEEARAWHSYAADWWMDHEGGGADEGQHQERLYHLVEAGRNTEACGLLYRKSEAFVDNTNEDLLSILKRMTVSPKHAEAIYNIRARAALDCKDAEDALACADALADYLTPDADLIRAEACMLTGDAQKGFDIAAAMFEKGSSPKAALVAARCLFAMKRHDEASGFLDSASKRLSQDDIATGIDDILMLRAGVAYARGRPEEALGYLSKAKKASRKKRVKERADALSKNIRNGKAVSFD